MAEPALFADRREVRTGQVLEPQSFEALRELTRHGYTPDADADAATGGLILRHEHAPDLVLRPDGTITVPAGQAVKQPVAPGAPMKRGISWRRTFLVLFLAAIVWVVSIMIAVGIFEG